jgi:hypothetical protein
MLTRPCLASELDELLKRDVEVVVCLRQARWLVHVRQPSIGRATARHPPLLGM